jgi:hypothetical protein
MDTNQLIKKIVIIEDKEKQYKKYKNWVENNLRQVEVIPSESKWQELKGAIQTFFMVSVSETEKENAKNVIEQELNQDFFGLILDYELEKNKPTTCNAQLFFENFISAKNIQHLLVISGIGGTKPNDWVQNLKLVNTSLSAEFIRIPKSDGPNFSDEVQKQIKEIFGNREIEPEKTIGTI